MKAVESNYNAEKLIESELTGEIVGAAIEVHKRMGPGLLESVYEECLLKELDIRGIPASSQVKVPLVYKGEELKTSLIINLLVGDKVIIEIKSVAEILPVHRAQILTYLKLTGKRIGFLLNFNVPKLMEGLERFAL